MAFTWNQVRDVVEAVLGLPPEQRSEYLARTSLEPDLRRYVDSLVLSYDRAGGFLDTPPLAALTEPATPESSPESRVGTRIGPYQLLEEIGKGGMGAVYRAVRADDQYRQQVAIKLVRSGFETAFALSRFRAERQILAGLEHPNIARLMDGGAMEDGRPYFVMELVEGLPIDEYCDSHKLSIPDRLRLFRTVCSAVEFAHQKLIVHRDLKPGNILISSDGTPKLLDFGIAKILAADDSTQAEATVTLLRMLTPEYSSPEQVAGGPVTTATDVYSLGVVLYIMLTGHRPYRVDRRRPDEMLRMICETEPARPSSRIAARPQDSDSADGAPAATPDSVTSSRGTKLGKLRRQLSGDLDNIVLMALRKQPQRRYASVEQLSEDIRRHLEGLPVRARKETLLYRSQKFAQRNKLAVATVALLLVSLSAGLIATAREARVARAQQVRAERRFRDVRDLANSLMFEIHDGIANLPGATPVRKLIVERALKYLDGLSSEAAGDRSLELELAAAYDRIGDVLGQPNEANLGNPAGAADSYKKALALRESLAARSPGDNQTLRELTTSYIRLSDLLWSLGDSDQALGLARKEIPTVQKLPNTDPQNRLLVAMCYVDQGYKEGMLGNPRAAGVTTLRAGTTMIERMLAETPSDASLRRRIALSYGRMGEIQRLDRQTDAEALESFRKAFAVLQPIISTNRYNAEVRRVAAYYQFTIGQLLGELNHPGAALAEEGKALASLDKLIATDPANIQVQKDIGRVHAEIGKLQLEQGRVVTAVAELTRALSLLEKMSDAHNPRTQVGYAILRTHFYLGQAHVELASNPKRFPQAKRDKCRQAQSWFQRCLPQFESLRGGDPQFSRDADSYVAEIHRQMARCPAEP